MNQYIITEEHLRNYRRGTITFEDIEDYARHHPYQSEREKVLDELKQFVALSTEVIITQQNNRYCFVREETLLKKIEELRQVKE